MAEYLIQGETLTALADKIREKTGKTASMTTSEMLSELDSISGLNFEVVGGTTQPTDPSENTIWVNTDVEITDYAFSYEQPSEVDGRVWFKTNIKSTVAFNALSENMITVYPVVAKQCISGTWVDKTAKTYQNGWKDWWYGQLYDSGNEFEAVTGGWVDLSIGNVSGGAPSKGTPIITRSETSIRLEMDKNGGMFYTANKINLSDFSILRFNGTVSRTSTLWKMVAWTEIPTTYSQTNMAASVQLPAVTNGEVTLDVSALNGEYYIGFTLYNADNYIEMTSLILE